MRTCRCSILNPPHSPSITLRFSTKRNIPTRTSSKIRNKYLFYRSWTSAPNPNSAKRWIGEEGEEFKQHFLPLLPELENDRLSEQTPSLFTKLPGQPAQPALPTQAQGTSPWVQSIEKEGTERSRKHFRVL